MKKLTLLLISLAVVASANSFSKSKKLLLKQVYHDHQYSFYCNNPYGITTVDGKERTLIVKDSKYYTPRNELTKAGKINERALRIEWEHVMPAENAGRHLECWKNGGRKNCQKDKQFQEMEADMHNLVPAIGEVNADRSNFRFTANKPQVGQYGNCEFQVDFKAKRAYPRDDIRGDIARAYLYMSERYGINLSSQEKSLMEAWHKLDPVDEWEIKKNERVKRLQGNGNPYVEGK